METARPCYASSSTWAEPGLETEHEREGRDRADQGEAVGGERGNRRPQPQIQAQVPEVVGAVPERERDHRDEEDATGSARRQGVGAVLGESALERAQGGEQADAGQEAGQKDLVLDT